MPKAIPMADKDTKFLTSVIQEGGEGEVTEDKPILIEATKEDKNTPMTA